TSDDDIESEDDIELPTKTMTIEEREKALIDISYMDEEEDASGQDGPLRTRNEVQKVVVQRPTITIKPEANIVEIGSVYAIVGDTVVVQGNVAGNEQVLDSGSLFVFGDREILGEIFETFGPVAKPLYSVRFNDASEIDKERTKQGAKVYIVPDFSTFLLTRALKMQKGSDASNIFDEEVAEHVSHYNEHSE
ncbi:Gar1/Naf1 RNA binding region-domain-containing protein, partial [Umbelopsis sp. PMI_123]